MRLRQPVLPIGRAAALAAVAVALALCASGVRAEEADVTGVDPDDVLNLRAEPRASAPLVGALSPTASRVEVLKRADGWAFVQSGALKGWAAARYLRPAFKPGDAPPLPLHCLGTEPFWSLTLDGKTATYATPDGKAPAVESGAFAQSRNSTIVWRVRPAGGPITLAIIEGRRACSDGMSDRVYSFGIQAETRDGQLLNGCCDVKQ